MLYATWPFASMHITGREVTIRWPFGSESVTKRAGGFVECTGRLLSIDFRLGDDRGRRSVRFSATSAEPVRRALRDLGWEVVPGRRPPW
jgi:hypothetical protein